MFKKKISVALLNSIVFLPCLIFADQTMELVQENYNFSPRALQIILDDSEDEIEAASEGLIVALFQKASPIIVSAFTVYTLFSESPSSEDKKYIIDNKKKLVKGLNFKESEWIIKKINPSLYLFIPNDYVKSIGLTASAVEQYKSSDTTQTELALGLNVNHMENSVIADILKNKPSTQYHATYFMDALYKRSDTKSSLFCTRLDYAKNKSIALPLWSIYMMGHGLMGTTIVGLSLQEFQEVLDFFENKINTKLLVYTSCYAAGLNADIIFKDAQSAATRRFSYPIVTQAITDAVTSLPSLSAKKGFVLQEMQDLKGFFKEVTQPETIDYQKALQYLFPLVPSPEGYLMWGNVPQIKFPGLEWFSPAASAKEIVSISSILSKTRDPKNPLDIVSYFKADPAGLLLYARNIPFELSITGAKLEAILSMIPGDATHTIKKISSPQKSIATIIDWFMNIRMLDSQKIFFIESVDTASGRIENLIIYNNKIPGRQGLSAREEKYENYAFYTQNGTMYIKELDSNPQEVDEKQKNDYLQFLNKFQGKFNQLGTFSFASTKRIRFPRIPNATKIEKIEGQEGSDVSIPDIISELRLIMAPGTFVWVKEMTGTYLSIDIDLPDITSGDRITVYDVIINKDTRDQFFTYNNTFYNRKKKLDSDYKPAYTQPSAHGLKKNDSSEITPENLQKIQTALNDNKKRESMYLPALFRALYEKASGLFVSLKIKR